MFNCPNCGRPQPDDSVFCEGCGTPISRYGAVQTGSPQPTKKRKSLVAIIAIAVVCIAAIVFLTMGIGPFKEAAENIIPGSESSSESTDTAAEEDSSAVELTMEELAGTYKMVNGDERLYLARDGKAAGAIANSYAYMGTWTVNSEGEGSLLLDVPDVARVEYTMVFSPDGDGHYEIVVTSDEVEGKYEFESNSITGMPTNSFRSSASTSSSSSSKSNSSSSSSSAQNDYQWYAYSLYDAGTITDTVLVIARDDDSGGMAWAMFYNAGSNLSGKEDFDKIMQADPDSKGTAEFIDNTHIRLDNDDSSKNAMYFRLTETTKGSEMLVRTDSTGSTDLARDGSKVSDSSKAASLVIWYSSVSS